MSSVLVVHLGQHLISGRLFFFILPLHHSLLSQPPSPHHSISILHSRFSGAAVVDYIFGSLSNHLQRSRLEPKDRRWYMGVSLVARVDAVGADGLQLIADRLMRDHQSQPRERWLAVIRSFRQPLPPISDHPTNHQQEDALHAPNKPKKQRALYCLRHSGRPGQLVAMIEDADAPSRLALNAAPPHLHLSPLLNIMNHKQTENPLPQTHDKQMGDAALDESHHAPSDQPFLQDNGTEAGKTPVPIHTAQESTDMAVDDETSAIRNPRVTTKEEPSHYRVSLVSVPDSFEQLLSSAICATQSTLVPSAWCPRPNMVAIEGMVWGIYSSSFESEIGSGSNLGAIPSNFSSKETQPDWWIRLGTVTNKGATSGNTSLPWLILELECAASPIELDYSSEFLESVMHAILKPNAQLLIKPFRPTEQNFLEAGLTPEHDPAHSTHPPKTSCLQNGYSMLMLAKQERLI